MPLVYVEVERLFELWMVGTMAMQRLRFRSTSTWPWSLTTNAQKPPRIFGERRLCLPLSLSLFPSASLDFKGVLELFMTIYDFNLCMCWMTPDEERQHQRAAVPMWQMRHMSLRAYWSEQNKQIQNECKQLCEYAPVKHFPEQNKLSKRTGTVRSKYSNQKRWDTAFWLLCVRLRVWKCLCASLFAHKVPPCRQAAAIDLTRSWGSEEGRHPM